MQTVERFGITVDLADGLTDKIVVPLQLEIPPRKATTFDIEFLTDKSVAFQVSGSCQYRIGRGSRKTAPLNVSWEGHTRVPRPLELSYEDTKELVAKVLQSDPSLVQRAKDWTKRLLDGDSSVRLSNLIQRGQSQSWKLRDALLVLLSSADADDQRFAAQVLASLAQQATAEPRPSWEVRSVLREVFPLLCRYQTSQAVVFAVRTATHGHVTDELVLCLCMRNTRPFLASYTAELRNSLGDFSAPERWTNRQIALGACLNITSEFSQILKIKMSSPNFSSEDIPTLIWAATQINRSEVDQGIRQQLRSSKVSGDAIRQVVDSLLACRNDRLRADIIAYATTVKCSSAHAEVLMACLRYLDRFRGTDARPLLLDLREYPYRSEIRNKAKAILGQS